MQDVTLSAGALLIAALPVLLFIIVLFHYKVTAKKRSVVIVPDTQQDIDYKNLRLKILYALLQKDLHACALLTKEFQEKYKREAWLDFAMLMELIDQREKDLAPRKGWPDFVAN